MKGAKFKIVRFIPDCKSCDSPSTMERGAQVRTVLITVTPVRLFLLSNMLLWDKFRPFCGLHVPITCDIGGPPAMLSTYYAIPVLAASIE